MSTRKFLEHYYLITTYSAMSIDDWALKGRLARPSYTQLSLYFVFMYNVSR